ncbi:hypothetical protein ZIOFF_073704 [Zingiber officinale]|uniref:xyloglucan:xyloglucosyl transferase n=1 Tax=Zingiber officinale TaxID=94328 RepID=A0A8J5C9N7_ZINOF|nr:hypothetical protein ZIOFF_073704 [Zingiber officinale]
MDVGEDTEWQWLAFLYVMFISFLLALSPALAGSSNVLANPHGIMISVLDLLAYSRVIQILTATQTHRETTASQGVVVVVDRPSAHNHWPGSVSISVSVLLEEWPALMALLLLASIAVSMLHWGGNAQPSPGYYPSNRFKPLPGFYHGYSNLWGAPHQIVSGDQSSVTLWLDRSSGSGFKSNRPYRSGYFAASIKLQAGYTAGVITAFYLSNDQAHPGSHDEVDIEFMGNTPGKPYRLQTNVYIRDRRPEYVGGEMKFRWFKPVDFHNYTIPMEPCGNIAGLQPSVLISFAMTYKLDPTNVETWKESLASLQYFAEDRSQFGPGRFYVDDIPIRRYPRKSADIFPMRPMWMYGTIWDASAWATDRGKYRVDYRYQPFVSRFTKFIIRGCSAFAPPNCRVAQSSPMGSGLSPQQYAAMRWVQNNYMVYNYCTDPGRDHSRTPECY